MRCFILAGLALCALTARAQSPRQCVNPANVDGLVFLGSQRPEDQRHHAMPAFMGGFRAPAGFSFIGTGVNLGKGDEGRLQDHAGQRQGLCGCRWPRWALKAGRWNRRRARATSSRWRLPRGWKRFAATGSGSCCQWPNPAAATFVSIRDAAGAQAPRLQRAAADDAVVRNGTERRAPFPVSGRQQSRAGRRCRQRWAATTTSRPPRRLISTENLDRLVALLGSQIQQQGWQPDSAWSGDRGAGSTWNKAGDGGAIRGTLEDHPRQRRHLRRGFHTDTSNEGREHASHCFVHAGCTGQRNRIRRGPARLRRAGCAAHPAAAGTGRASSRHHGSHARRGSRRCGCRATSHG